MDRDSRLKHRAIKCLKDNTTEYEGNRLIVPSRYTYKGVWNWDSMFHAVAVSKWNRELALEQIRYFTDRQAKNGMYCDCFLFNRQVGDRHSKPPLVAWALSEILKDDKTIAYLDQFYGNIKNNLKFWENFRTEDGLFKYGAEMSCDLYVQDCKNESGWDNSVRWDCGAENVWAIDLNSYIALTYKIMSDFAKHLGLHSESEEFKAKYIDLGKKINERLWCEELGAYCDYNFLEQGFTGVISPASFFPLFAGVADNDKAETMSKMMKDNYKFYPLLPTVSYDCVKYSSNDYWRGPTWLNVAYFALKGLKKYGYIELYNEYKDRLLNMCDKEKRGIFEYYDSKSGKGLGAKQFGWSAAFILQFINDS